MKIYINSLSRALVLAVLGVFLLTGNIWAENINNFNTESLETTGSEAQLNRIEKFRNTILKVSKNIIKPFEDYHTFSLGNFIHPNQEHPYIKTENLLFSNLNLRERFSRKSLPKWATSFKRPKFKRPGWAKNSIQVLDEVSFQSNDNEIFLDCATIYHMSKRPEGNYPQESDAQQAGTNSIDPPLMNLTEDDYLIYTVYESDLIDMSDPVVPSEQRPVRRLEDIDDIENTTSVSLDVKLCAEVQKLLIKELKSVTSDSDKIKFTKLDDLGLNSNDTSKGSYYTITVHKELLDIAGVELGE